jgi:AcrR family transcriptional regulator
MPEKTTRRPARADAMRNEQALVEAARQAFAEKGIDSSLDDIAKKAGVGIGTLYRHFPTRQDLVEAILADQLLRLAEHATALLHAPDAYKALRSWLLDAASKSKPYRGQSECVAVALNKCADTTSAQSPCEAMREACNALLRRAQQQGTVRDDITVDSLMTMMNAIAWTREHDSKQTDILLSVMLEGLRPAH